MQLYEAIKNRRSVRKFKNIPIPDDVIKEMLEAARLVPTPGNAQGNLLAVKVHMEFSCHQAWFSRPKIPPYQQITQDPPHNSKNDPLKRNLFL